MASTTEFSRTLSLLRQERGVHNPLYNIKQDELSN